MLFRPGFFGPVALAGILAVTGSLGTWRFVAFNLWVEEDASSLRPYPAVLVHGPRDPPSTPGSLDELDREIIAHNGYGRLVVHMSRGEVRHSLTGRRAWVKVYLETRHPTDSSAVQRIKLLNTLDRRDGHWHVTSADWLTIP